MRVEAEPYRSDEEVLEVVRRFESCEFPPDDFKHRQHLIVALCYLLRGPEREAHAKVRDGILKFLAHHRIDPSSVYHETLTVFWIKLVQKAISEVGHGSFVLTTNEVLERLADPRIIFEYYSEACLKTDIARSDWVEPDLKPLKSDKL